MRRLAAALAALFLAQAARAGDQTPLKQVTGAEGTHPATFGAGDTVGVPHGGTGQVTLSAHCVIIGEGTSNPVPICPVSSGRVLTDNGASADPSFQPPSVTGPGGTNGQIEYNNAGSFGGFTMAGDCSVAVPNIACTKTAGVSFGYFATGTDASNLTGTLGCGRVPTLTGDVSNSSCAITVSKTGGVAFGYFATGADAANLTGTISVNRFNSGTSASTTTWLRGDGTWVTPSGSGIGTVTSIGTTSPICGGTITSSGTIAPCSVAAGHVMANSASGSAAWADTTVTALIDQAFGSTRGALIERGASGWQIVAPGAANFALVSNGSGADPSWQLPPAGANPLIVGPAQIGAGAGSPPITTYCANGAGEGSLCLRNDLGFAYSMWDPPTSIPARVQEAISASSGSYTVTLGAAPTPGDYLVAFAFRSGSVPTLSAGWTSIATHTAVGATDAYAVLAYHLVNSGDTTTQTPASGAANSIGAAIVEVSGLDMTNFSNSLQASSFTGVSHANGALSTTLTATTSSANTLALSFGAGTVQSSLNFSGGPIGINSGWTNTVTANLNGQTWTSQALASSQAYPSSSSSVTATVSGLSTGSTADGQTQALVLLQSSTDPLTTGFQQVSYLTTVKNGGSTVAANARSLNFSSGLTASADADFNVTVIDGPWTGDASISAGAVTVSKYNGGTSFGTFAGQNYATPPAIGGTTPAAGSFSSLLDTGMAGSGARCVHVDASGNLSAASGDCAAGGSGSVTSVTCAGSTVITTSGSCTGTLIGIQRITATGAYTYTPTSGTASVIIELQGAGGGGSGVAGPSNASNATVGAGGSAGCWLRVRLTANFSGGTGSVGAKGTGGAAGNNNGNNGGNTTFVTTAGSPVTYTAAGGTGGGRTTGGVAQVVGPVAGATCTNGDDQEPGGSSPAGAAFPGPFFSFSGAGGISHYSTGAIAAYLAANPGTAAGVNAAGKGGGGSGAVANGNTASTQAGGDGSNGVAIIWEYDHVLVLFAFVRRRRRRPANDDEWQREAA